MRKNVAVLLLLVIVRIALSLARGEVGSYAMDVWPEQAQQPPSATDTILQSWKTSSVPLDNDGHETSLRAGPPAVTLVIFGAVLIIMRGEAKLLRQWRLLRKQPARHKQQMPCSSPATWTNSRRHNR
jgi:hypothetical protein